MLSKNIFTVKKIMSWANYMKPDMNWTLQIDGKNLDYAQTGQPRKRKQSTAGPTPNSPAKHADGKK